MLKAKLCGFAVAFMIGCVGINPANIQASETNSESVTLSEATREQKDQKAAFDEMMKKAEEKWNTLTEKQKAEVYTLLENEMNAEIKLMDKLVELNVMQKEDAAVFRKRMQEKLNELKKSGEFPLSRPKRERKQK